MMKLHQSRFFVAKSRLFLLEPMKLTAAVVTILRPGHWAKMVRSENSAGPKCDVHTIFQA